jgi:hypothetical protein
LRDGLALLLVYYLDESHREADVAVLCSTRHHTIEARGRQTPYHMGYGSVTGHLRSGREARRGIRPHRGAEEFIRQARANRAHVDATLVLFDPDMTPAAIRAKAPVKGRSGYFANGEISKRCREAIRLAGGEPVAAESIVRQAMTDKGLDPEDAKLRRDMIRRFLWALHRMHVAGSVVRIGRGLGARCGATDHADPDGGLSRQRQR